MSRDNTKRRLTKTKISKLLQYIPLGNPSKVVCEYNRTVSVLLYFRAWLYFTGRVTEAMTM